jgi:hypothetical protein
MKRFASQTRVEGGYYVNTSSWAIKAIDGEGGVLPGDPGTTSIRLMLPLLIIAALALSFVFIIFLPFIGFALFASVVAGAAGRALARVGLALTHTFAPQWRPGEAWLTRRAHPTANQTPEALQGLRQEVDARRSEEAPPSKKA